MNFFLDYLDIVVGSDKKIYKNLYLEGKLVQQKLGFCMYVE